MEPFFIMAQRVTKKTGFVPVGTVVKRLLAGLRGPTDSQMERIWSLWPSAVGARICVNARPTAFKGHTLYVNVGSSPWMQELRFLKADIIEKLNSALDSNLIKDIKFRLGPV